jgi:mono/diheme cytochrome c family protein
MTLMGRPWGNRVLAALMVCAASVVYADDPPVPSPDAVLDALLQSDPAAIKSALDAMRAQADALAAESAALKEQAAGVDRELEKVRGTLSPLQAFLPAPPKTVMAKEPTEAKEAMAGPKVTYTDHVFPMFEQFCVKCHNEDKRRGGLSLASFNQSMEGGSSGQVILPGDPDGSRLVRLVEWAEEPIMPPKGDGLSDEQIEVIRNWIAEGAPRDTNSKVRLAKKTMPTAPEEIFVAAGGMDGPPPMPEVALAAVASPLTRAPVARSIAASPTAPLLAVAGEQQILLYNLDSNALMGALPFPEGDVFTMTFSFNGQLLLTAGGQEGASAAAVLWDVRKAERIGTYGRGYDTILAADISPDHRMIALGGPDRKVRVYATADGAQLYELKGHTDWVMSAKFSPDGELLATGDRAGNLLLWQAANGRAVEPLRGHNGSINALSYTYDSNVLASAGGDGKVFLWDTWKYKAIRNFNAHGGEVLSVDINKANEIVTSGNDGLTKRWGMDGKEKNKFESLGDWAYQTVFGKGGDVVASGNWGGAVAVWNAADAKRVATLTTNPELIKAEDESMRVAAETAAADAAGAP